jgi:DNA-binding HxlR family transcriptional regulator
MEDQNLNFKVSGRTVFCAVKNYLDNNKTLQDKISETVKQLVDSGELQRQIERKIREHMDYHSYSFEKTINNAIKNVVDFRVQEKINNEVQAAIKRSLQNAVFVVPEVD